MVTGTVSGVLAGTGLAEVTLTCPPSCSAGCAHCKYKEKGDFIRALAINTARASEGDSVEVTQLKTGRAYQYMLPVALLLIAYGLARALGGDEALAWLIGLGSLVVSFFLVWLIYKRRRGKRPEYEIVKIRSL